MKLLLGAPALFIAVCSVFAVSTLVQPAKAAVEVVVVTTDPNYGKNLSDGQKLQKVCQLAERLQADLDGRYGADLRVSKEAMNQARTISIRMLACPSPTKHK